MKFSAKIAISCLLMASNYACTNDDPKADSPKSQNQRVVSIANPSCSMGGITCDKTEGNTCYFSVSGDSANLQDGDYISIMLQLPGGHDWWHTGNSLRYNESFTSNWMLSMATVDVNGISRSFIARALITRQEVPAGGNYKALPENVGSSGICQWHL